LTASAATVSHTVRCGADAALRKSVIGKKQRRGLMRTVKVFGDTYVSRIVDHELDELLAELPAVVLDGPKGVGKAATAARRSATIRRLDDEAVAAVVTADPSIVTTDRGPVLLDEWQRVPGVWDVVRRAVDKGRRHRATY
jgi:predicted AAA+ superfamily ATPase